MCVTISPQAKALLGAAAFKAYWPSDANFPPSASWQATLFTRRQARTAVNRLAAEADGGVDLGALVAEFNEGESGAGDTGTAGALTDPRIGLFIVIVLGTIAVSWLITDDDDGAEDEDGGGEGSEGGVHAHPHPGPRAHVQPGWGTERGGMSRPPA